MSDTNEPILGIDLGTTNSVVAVVLNGEVKVLEENGTAILPSVVGVDEKGQLLVGAAARNQFVLFPERTVKSIKRKMGDDVTVSMGGKSYTPQQISSIILKTLKERAEKQLGRPMKKAVITVPAFFNDLQRSATRQAGEIAGLEVVRIINEPTAAALTYKPHPTEPETVLVYDLGGGTFDCSIVRIEQGVVEVLASHGDTYLGGDDFDQLVLNRLCDEFQQEHGIDLRTSAIAFSRLLHAAEHAKIRLSDEAYVTVEEEFIAEKDGTPLHLEVEFDRTNYEAMIERLVSKTLKHVDASLTDAKINATDIKKVLLVGGSTRTPLVQQLLAERLGQPVSADLHPDLSVAMGAAIQGALIAGVDVGPVLVDITPHTLGINCVGTLRGAMSNHRFAPVIHRNSPLPSNRTEIFNTVVDGQEQVDVKVYQGEDEDVRNNQLIGRFLLDGLDKEAEAGNEIVVRFMLDLNGMLQVKTTEKATGLERSLTIENALTSGGLAAAAIAAQQVEFTTAAVRDPGMTDEEAAASDAELSEEVVAAIRNGRDLVAKARELVAKAADDDKEELRDLIERMETAISSKDAASIEDAGAALEDLVFYLQDA